MTQRRLLNGHHKGKGFIFFLCMVLCLGAQAQTTTVSGTISDVNGPLPGVTVVVKGTANGTVADFDGNYSISNVPPDGILEFSYLGYLSQEIPVNGKSKIDLVMEQGAEALEEVVVVGYGTQRKENVTGSVASISGGEMREVPSSDFSQAIQGRLPGVQLSQTSSKPGASMQIRIRGVRSLTASNDPLIVLDGIAFSGSISDIDPNNIKSIDILKDASATAIYGSRGANGVILITTDKGQKGQEAKFNFNSYYGVKDVFAPYPMMDGPTYVQLRKDAGKYPSNGLDEFNDVNTDWQDLVYGSAIVTSQDIGVTGGTEKGNYSFGLGYYKDEAVIPGQNYQRFTLRASVDQEIGKYIRVGITTNNTYSISNGNNSGAVYGALNSSPIADPYNDDGSIKRVISMPADDQWVYTRETVNSLGDAWIDQTKSFGSYNSIYGEVKIPGVEGLSYRINLGLNYKQSNGGSYTGEGVFSTTPDNPSSASISNSLTTKWAVENLVTYDRTFGKHHINLLGLYSAENNFYNRSYVSARGINSDAFQFYNLGRTNEPPVVDPDQQHYEKSGLMSGMGRLIYSYDNRYLLTASYRYDGSSRLAEGHKWVDYPAISIGWNLHNEAFLKNNDFINMLKLRVGYGTTSNQSIDPYSTLGLLGTRPYNFDETFTTGYYVTNLPNPDLGWEYSKTWNYAVDFSILKNRLTGTVEYYDTKTENLLFSLGLPPTSGVSSYVANIGSSQNKGYEVSLNGVIFDHPDGFTWEAGVNFYSNHNELTSLASGQEKDEGNWWFVGHPINVIYDYKNIGIWQEGEANRDILEPGGNVGMIKVEYTGDYNADGTPTRAISGDDRQIFDMEPDFQGGFNTRLAYKGVDLSIVGTFQSGGLLIATPYGANGYLNILTARRGNIDVDYWTPENTDAKFPKPGGIGGDQPKYLNTLSYFDASYLKIRTITLGYNFSQKLVKDFGLDKLRLYGTVQNPLVFFSPYHDQSGMDPETNSYANENSAVPYEDSLSRLLAIGTNTPTTTNYIIGLNLSF